jgi:hypothetical protein
LRRLFNQQRNKARRAYIEAGLAEVAAGGGDNAPAAQCALAAAAAAAGQAEAAAEDAEDAEDAEAAELETAHPSPEAAASPPASSTPIPAPTAEDTVELELLPMPRSLVNAFPQAATRSPSRSLPFPLAHLPLAPATATPPLAPVPSPAVQSTAQPPQPSDYAAHPVANDAFHERLAGHVAGRSAHGKNDKRKHTAAEKAAKLAEKAAEEEIKKQKKQAGESTSAPSHAAQANAANILAAKDLATSKAALAKAEAALAKEEAAIRKVTLAAVCAYLIFGAYAPCSQ